MKESGTKIKTLFHSNNKKLEQEPTILSKESKTIKKQLKKDTILHFKDEKKKNEILSVRN